MIIELPIAPRTKKNSQQIVVNRQTGRPFVMPSKLYKDYEKQCARYIPKLKAPIDVPVNVCCIYYMPTHRRVDLVNLQEATLDILVKYGVLADDNANIVVSMDGSQVRYDKDEPRTMISILPYSDEAVKHFAETGEWRQTNRF